MKLAELMREVDDFVKKYAPTGTTIDRDKMKSDILDLVQKAVDHGEGKDQNKIVGMVTWIAKNFFSGKKD